MSVKAEIRNLINSYGHAQVLNAVREEVIDQLYCTLDMAATTEIEHRRDSYLCYAKRLSSVLEAVAIAVDNAKKCWE